jgi:type III restriction enzyme
MEGGRQRMTPSFFDHPILNSPYEYPGRHWELDDSGQPTSQVIDDRRRVSFISPIPKPKRQRAREQAEMIFEDPAGVSSADQQYDSATTINELRQQVDQWRALPNPSQWLVSPETARLLEHWRHHAFHDIRPFFCQVEAVETAIWLSEVAPKRGPVGKRFLDRLAATNEQANPGLARLALKLATGAGKTTVMAMLIAWQTVNAVRHPNSKNFTRGFLIVTPGITIRDRLRVLHPNDPDSYFKTRELVPTDMLPDVNRAKIVITNYHAFKLRETLSISKTGRLLLQGRGPELQTLETEGQMLQRVLPDLMGMKNVMVLNDREFGKLGYDIESRVVEGPDKGRLRFIEVKGRVTQADTVTVTRNEILTSLNKPDDFILAMVRVPRRQGTPRSLPAAAVPARAGLRGDEYELRLC